MAYTPTLQRCRSPRIRRRWSLVAALVALAAVTAACGSSTSGGSSSPGHVYRIRLALPDTLSSPIGKAAAAFKSQVEKNSAGQIAIQLYPSGELGSETSVQTQTQQGTLQMNIYLTDFLATTYAPIEMLDPPYLYASVPQSEAVLNKLQKTQIGQTMLADLTRASNTKILSFMTFGMKQIELRSQTPIDKPADFSGLKIRITSDKMFVDTYNALRANVSTIDTSELYLALQEGNIEAEELALPSYLDDKTYEIAKYVSMVNEQVSPAAVEINEKFYKSLPSRLQAVLQAAAVDTSAPEWTAVEKGEPAVVSQLEAQGVLINNPPSSFRNAIQAKVRPIWESVASSTGSEGTQLLSEIEKLVASTPSS